MSLFNSQKTWQAFFWHLYFFFHSNVKVTTLSEPGSKCVQIFTREKYLNACSIYCVANCYWVCSMFHFIVWLMISVLVGLDSFHCFFFSFLSDIFLEEDLRWWKKVWRKKSDKLTKSFWTISPFFRCMSDVLLKKLTNMSI